MKVGNNLHITIYLIVEVIVPSKKIKSNELFIGL